VNVVGPNEPSAFVRMLRAAAITVVPSKVTVIWFAVPVDGALNPVPEIVTVSPTTPDVGSKVIFGSTSKGAATDRPIPACCPTNSSITIIP